MEDTRQQTIDLIDDIWQKIFGSLDSPLRARLCQVNKRWQTILANPLCWTDLVVKFPAESEPEADTRLASLSKFIPKYCTLTSRVSIELYCSAGWRILFASLFTLRNLTHLRLMLGVVKSKKLNVLKFKETIAPIWPNLVFLAIGGVDALRFPKSLAERVFKGAPNIEELYLHHRFNITGEDCTSVFKPLHKLKYLSVTENLLRPSSATFGASVPQPELIVNQIPHLQILVLFRTSFFGQQPASNQNYCGTTLVIDSSFLRSRDLSNVKKIGSLLQRSNYALYFIRDQKIAPRAEPHIDVDLLHYLFKELEIDINCNTADSNPFVADLFTASSQAMPMCPLSSVIGDVNGVRQMLDFGADPNMSHPDMSPFASPDVTKESCLLLLERGADPLKKVKGKAAMAHLFSSPNLSDEDLAEFILMILLNGVDANYQVAPETTLLDIAIQSQCPESARVLLLHGARWTPKAVDELIIFDSKWWVEVIESRKFDTKDLHLRTVLLAVKLGLYHLVREYLQNYSQDLDTNGYSLSHYLLVLPLLEQPSLITLVRVKKVATEMKGTPKFFTNMATSTAQNFGGNFNFTGTIAFRDANVGHQPPFGNNLALPTPKQAAPETTPIVAFAKSPASQRLPLEQIIEDVKLDVNLKSAKGETPLLLVCENQLDDADPATVLINSGANVNEPDVNGWTPLHAALYLRKYKTAKLLLSRGANINAQDTFGVTPMMAFVLASKFKDSTMWKHLLSRGPDVTLTDKYMSRSLLHHLSMSPLRNCLAFLLETVPGIDVNCRDAQGFTPLHYAAIYNEKETMELLIKHGADTNAMSYTLKLTPLAMLTSIPPSSSYHRYVTSLSTVYSTSPIPTVTYVGPKGTELAAIVVNQPPWISGQSLSLKTGSANFQSLSLTFWPLPSDLHLKDQFGNNLLHYIVLGGLTYMLFDKMLLKLNDLWSVPNKFGTTPFHALLRNSQSFEADQPRIVVPVSVLEMLLTHWQHQLEYSLNNTDEHGCTGAQYLLCNPMWSELRENLMRLEGIKLSSPVTDRQSSFIHDLIENNVVNSTMLTKMAESDPASLNHKINGKTPLMLYIEKVFTQREITADKQHGRDQVERQIRSQIGLIDDFVRHKADLNAQDNHGNTALHYACYFFHLGGWDQQQMHTAHVFSFILFKLLEAGARVDVKNNEGQTATDIIPNLLELDRSLLHRVDMHPPPIENLKVERPTRPIDLFM